MKKTKQTKSAQKTEPVELTADTLAAIIGGGDTRSGSRDGDPGTIIIIDRDGP